ncbi:NAD(P)-binding protein [Streptomyces sp. NPDC048045]|uniref:NAD(P)-binding protein n=1 Tax=Streptomyces sp. NPDC048045 TaxID=3154710 RepID=UPI003433D8D8
MAARLLSHRPGPSRSRALVVGAGIAGLLAARVLADSFSRVEILEQDSLPPEPRRRPGVPQGHHVHGLTARGAEVTERLFPGLRDELTDAGAPGGDFGEIVALRLTTVQQTMSVDPERFGRFLAAMHMTRSSAVLLHPRALLALASTARRPDAPAHDDARLWWGRTSHAPRRTTGTSAPSQPPQQQE